MFVGGQGPDLGNPPARMREKRKRSRSVSRDNGKLGIEQREITTTVEGEPEERIRFVSPIGLALGKEEEENQREKFRGIW